MAVQVHVDVGVPNDHRCNVRARERLFGRELQHRQQRRKSILDTLVKVADPRDPFFLRPVHGTSHRQFWLHQLALLLLRPGWRRPDADSHVSCLHCPLFAHAARHFEA